MFEELHNEPIQWTVRAYIGKELSYKYQAMLHTVLELKAVVVSDTGFSDLWSSISLYERRSTVESSYSIVFGLAFHRYTMQSCSPSADRFINCCTCAYCHYLSLSLIMRVARASVSTAYLKTHKASQNNWQLTFHLPFSYKHGAETGRSRLTLRAQPSPSPSLHHGSVQHQQHAAFNGNSAPSLIKWMEKREHAMSEHLQTSAMWESEVAALWSWLLWIQRLMCAAPYRIAPSLSLLSDSPSAATRPSSTLCHQQLMLQHYEEV